MMPLKVIEVDLSSEARVKAETGPTVQYAIVNIVVRHTIKGIAQHLARNAKSVAMTTISSQSVKVVQMKAIPNMIIANTDSKKEKEKSFMR